MREDVNRIIVAQESISWSGLYEDIEIGILL